MTLFHVLSDVEYELISGGNLPVSSIVKDAPKVTKGAVYVCIQGISGDGHNYINDAVANGASAIVTDKRISACPEGVTVIRVDNSRIALGFMCRSFYGYPLKNISVTGVTGTNGKTSTTYFLEGIFAAAGKKCAVIGTSGIRIAGEPLDIKYATSTTPDTIELFQAFSVMRQKGVTDIFMEATSHALTLEKLCAIEFEQSIFTNLTQDHIDFHKSFDNYLMAKTKLFHFSKVGILNSDDPSSAKIADMAACRFFWYGVENNSDFRAGNIKYFSSGSDFEIVIGGKKEKFHIEIPGGFSVYNALGAISAASLAGITPDVIRAGLLSVTSIPGRIQTIPNNRGIGILVDYAHTPDGLQKVITAARSFTKGRVITMFGCGGDRDRTKRPIMGKIAGELSDFCVVTSDNPRSERPEDIISEILPGVKGTGCEYIAEADRGKAVFAAIEFAKPGDTVILAGKGHETYQEFENMRRISFDDREAAARALKELEIKA